MKHTDGGFATVDILEVVVTFLVVVVAGVAIVKVVGIAGWLR